MIVAIHFFADDTLAFVPYAALLVFSLFATICTINACIIYHHLEHWVEPKLAFTGIHGVIASVLFYFHLAVKQKIDCILEGTADFALL
jgi:hypothetical protein